MSVTFVRNPVVTMHPNNLHLERFTCPSIFEFHNGRSFSLPNNKLQRRLSAESASPTELIHFNRRSSQSNCNVAGTTEEVIKHFEARIANLEERLSTISQTKSPGENKKIIPSPGCPNCTHQQKFVLPLNQVSTPGLNASLPHPKLHSIRQNDGDVREVTKEFKLLCKEPISDASCQELRRSTFNNWLWTDAHLLRFVRHMFEQLGLVQHFVLSLQRIEDWLIEVYKRYNVVPFHNFKHAFMVTQMMYSIIWEANLAEILQPLDLAVLITASICHDLDHPGFNNAYQINAGTQLAMRYNDQSPLENHHASVAFDILSHPEADPFCHLPQMQRKYLREGIIRCILATDMSRHNTLLSQFQLHLPRLIPTLAQMVPEDKDLVMMILIKVADISNESRPLEVAATWIDNLLEEFFYQTDHEKTCDLPVAPFMDREKVTKAASQCSFIQFVILPLFQSVVHLFPALNESILKPAQHQLDFYTKLASELPNDQHQ